MVWETNMKKLYASAAALALLGSMAISGTANAAVKDKPFFKVGGLVMVWGAQEDGAGGFNQNVVSDFYLLGSTPGAASDLIGGTTDVTGTTDAVVTGSFDPITGEVTPDGFNDAGTIGVLDAADTFNAFEIDNTTDVDGVMATDFTGQFFVASNATFNIQAKRQAVVETLGSMTMDNIKWDMDIDVSGAAANGSLAFGSDAQHPGGIGGLILSDAGVVPTILDLGDIAATDTLVFTGAQRTAATRGSIAEQSVRFNTSYTLDTDLSTPAVNEGYDLSVGTGELSAEVVYTVYTP
jgi:hypothetical protein